MKKVLSIILSVMLVATLNISAFAADVDARQPDVYVNGKIVEFKDQAPYITDEGRTLVPARGVFEAMGSVVDWDPENYVVTVSNETQKKEISLKIGDANMTVKTADEETTKVLDVPAQLMNNRTMIPLRAVSEALESVVVWNPGDYSVYISMSQKISIDQFPSFFPTGGSTNKKDDVIYGDDDDASVEENVMSISLSEETVKAGETVEIKVNVENNPGVISINMHMEYDESIVLKSVNDADVFDDSYHSNEHESPYLLSWASDLALENVAFNGELATITFEVPESVPAGEYEIKLHAKKVDVYDLYLNEVPFVLFNGKIIVE